MWSKHIAEFGAGGNLLEQGKEERCALVLSWAQRQTVLNFLDFFCGSGWFEIYIELPSINLVLQGGLLWAGEEFSLPWGPGFWGHGADLTARADVEHQDRPNRVGLAHKTEWPWVSAESISDRSAP